LILRFDRLDCEAHEFSPVVGRGGEDQMNNAAPSRTTSWNILQVQLK
jgi:hypothetical protein